MSTVRRFKNYSIVEFEKFIASVAVARKITHIQIHHTASPTLNGYRLAKDKEGVIRAMWTYHTVSRKFQDIAQHFSIAPDGIWDGRSLALNPGGFLGAQNNGGLMFEIIGFFDKGKEAFAGDIAEMTFRAVAACKKRWPDADIQFHRDQPGANKTCPGSAIDKTWFVSKVDEYTKPPKTTACDILYGYGVPFSLSAWNQKEKAYPALATVLDAIADNWMSLGMIPYAGDLIVKIGEKIKSK